MYPFPITFWALSRRPAARQIQPWADQLDAAENSERVDVTISVWSDALDATEDTERADLTLFQEGDVVTLSEEWFRDPVDRTRFKDLADVLSATELAALVELRSLDAGDAITLIEDWQRTEQSRPSTNRDWGDTLNAVDTGAISSNVPLDFAAEHDFMVCPTRQVRVTTSSSGTKVLQHSTDSLNWTTLDSNWTALEYVHGSNGPVEGSNFYRARFASESEWATASAGVLCPE